jgi:RimJ/RimL family protein N-acetyltransferase
MSRLLHAAARGASPDQLEYQYGPVSTEVRKAAETIAKKAYLHEVLGHYGLAAIDDYLSRSNEFGYCWDKAMNATAMQKQLFLLILAEALADEGM